MVSHVSKVLWAIAIVGMGYLVLTGIGDFIVASKVLAGAR